MHWVDNCLGVDWSFYCVFYGLQAKVHPFMLPTPTGGTAGSELSPGCPKPAPSKPFLQRAWGPIPPCGHWDSGCDRIIVTESLQQTISSKHHIRSTTFFHLNCVTIKGKKLHFTGKDQWDWKVGKHRWDLGHAEVRDDWREPSCTEGVGEVTTGHTQTMIRRP